MLKQGQDYGDKSQAILFSIISGSIDLCLKRYTHSSLNIRVTWKWEDIVCERYFGLNCVRVSTKEFSVELTGLRVQRGDKYVRGCGLKRKFERSGETYARFRSRLYETF